MGKDEVLDHRLDDRTDRDDLYCEHDGGVAAGNGRGGKAEERDGDQHRTDGVVQDITSKTFAVGGGGKGKIDEPENSPPENKAERSNGSLHLFPGKHVALYFAGWARKEQDGKNGADVG